MDNQPNAPTHRQLKKLWALAQTRSNQVLQQQTNTSVESSFIRLLRRAKELSVNDRQAVFERDFRKDKSESETAMHAFMSSSLYLLLECDYGFNFVIHYAFYKCAFENELRAMMVGYPFDVCAQEVKLTPNFSTFYANVLNYQDKKFIARLTR